MPQITNPYGVQLCSEAGCSKRATYICDYQGCGRLLCYEHLRDLKKIFREYSEPAERVGVAHLAGVYCQKHAVEIGDQVKWRLKVDTVLGYVGATIKTILHILWEMSKALVKGAFK